MKAKNEKGREMKSKKVEQKTNYENFCLLKLFTAHMGLTYEEFTDFREFDVEYEILADEPYNSLENDYCDLIHRIGYQTRKKYLAYQLKEARKVLRDILQSNPDFDLYWVGAV